MGGHVLESWKEEMIRIGRAEGHAEGRAEGHAEGRAEGHAEGRVEGHAEGRKEVILEQQKKLEEKVRAKIRKGKSVAQIADELEEDVGLIQPIYIMLLENENKV